MTSSDDLAEGVGLAAAALILATLVPFTAAEPLAALPYGLFILLAGYAGIALTLAVTGTTGDDWQAVAARLRAAVSWSGCGVAMLLALAAVALTAQTLDLRNIVLAQRNTLPFALLQPVAALVFVVALAAVGSHGVRPPGGASGVRRFAEGLHLFTGCAVGSTLFLAGYAGPGLPGPVWLLGKTVALMAVVLIVARRIGRLTDERRRALAWRALAPVALLNLVGTLVVVGRPQ